MNNKDIDGNEISVGNLVIKATNGSLTRHIVTGITPNNNIVLSCRRSPGGYIDFSASPICSDHNSKHYKGWSWGEMLVVDKNPKIPEALHKFIKHG